MSPPPVHIVIMQPAGYVHSLGFVDQARYLRYQLRRLGAEVTLAKNRLRQDAVNLVLGAHLGFPADLLRSHACVIVNLEQLGRQGAAVSPAYLQLLRQAAVIDYDAANVMAYGARPDSVPLISFLHAPYLDDGQALPLEQRPIDLLFFGSINPRRRHFIERVEAAGAEVTLFDGPIYGDERDGYIRQAKAVLNCHFYETSRFEQARAFHCLSLGTPVISERCAATSAPDAFDHAVFWLEEGQLERFFATQFRAPAYFDQARRQLAAFARHDPIESYARLLAYAIDSFDRHRRGTDPLLWRPRRLRWISGADYEPGWLNVSADVSSQPDLQLDLAQTLALPCQQPAHHGGGVRLEAGQFDLIQIGDAWSTVTDPRTLMHNALALLAVHGELVIEITGRSVGMTARAAVEEVVAQVREHFWQLGWFDQRFEPVVCRWLDPSRQETAPDRADSAVLTLRKVQTSPRERTLARTMRVDFGGIAEDRLSPAAVQAASPGAPGLSLRAA